MQASNTNGWHACSTGEADNILTVFDEYRYGYWCEHKRRVAMRVGTESGMREVNPKERYPGRAICSLSRYEKQKVTENYRRGTVPDDEQELRSALIFENKRSARQSASGRQRFSSRLGSLAESFRSAIGSAIGNASGRIG